MLREAYPTFNIDSWTRLHTLDGKVEGALFDMPAGEVRAAFGFNVTRETFYTPGNEDAANGLITQQGGSWFDGARNTYALFAETVAPLTDKLELDAALRLDKYPNFNANLAPKIGLKYQALPQLLLRGTYSEGFRAPSLAESGSGGVYAQLGGYRDEVRCDETNAIANLLLQSQPSAGDVDMGNSLLEHRLQPHRGAHDPAQPGPEAGEGRHRYAGLRGRADLDWLSLSADYWFIYRRNEIRCAGLQQGRKTSLSMTRSPITDADRAAQAAAGGDVRRSGQRRGLSDSACRVTRVGNVSSVVGQYKNQGRTLIDGFDIDARARFAPGRLGQSQRRHRRDHRAPQRGLPRRRELRWYYGNTVGYYGNPRLRATINADWTYQPGHHQLLHQLRRPHQVGVGSRRCRRQQPPDLHCRLPAGARSRSATDVPSWWTANLERGLAGRPTSSMSVSR